MEDFDAFDCVSNVFSELHSKREVSFPLTSMCLVCENSTLFVNNQCDVVVYRLSGSRSPCSVSPVEESTITPHVLGLWEFHSLCKQSMWCGCLRIEWIKVSTRCQSCRRIYNYSTYLWYLMIPFDTLWYFVILFDTLWDFVIPRYTLWYFVMPCDTLW